MSVAQVKHNGSWVPFNTGSVRVRAAPDGIIYWVRPAAIYVKHNGAWVRTVLHWG